jgi:NADH:ubiquinone oxidoreductase subunit 4 (subunit M)
MGQPHILILLLIALPLAAAVVVAALGPRRAVLVRWISLVAAVASLAIAVVLAGHLKRRPQ